MARALAFTQFFIVSLGAFALHLLVKIDGGSVPAGAMADSAQFLARHVLWLFAAPILYAAIGTAIEGKAGTKAVQAAGLVLCAILVVLLGVPIWFHLS